MGQGDVVELGWAAGLEICLTDLFLESLERSLALEMSQRNPSHIRNVSSFVILEFSLCPTENLSRVLVLITHISFSQTPSQEHTCKNDSQIGLPKKEQMINP